MHEVLVNRLGGLSLPRKSLARLTDRPDMTLDVTVDVKQQYNQYNPAVGWTMRNLPGNRANNIYSPGSDKLAKVQLYMSTSCQPGSRVFRAFSGRKKAFFLIWRFNPPNQKINKGFSPSKKSHFSTSESSPSYLCQTYPQKII